VHPRLDPIHGPNINAPGGDDYNQLGFTASGSDTLRHCEDLLAMLIAGRAAEQIVVGKVSAGSGGSDQSDLARATRLTLALEHSLGFGAIQPPLYRDDKDLNPAFYGNPGGSRSRAVLARAMESICENRHKLDALTEPLAIGAFAFIPSARSNRMAKYRPI